MSLEEKVENLPTATGVYLMKDRLGRIVDRRRVVHERLHTGEPNDAEAAATEIGNLHRRTRLIYYAIFCAVLSALLVCLVVAGAFGHSRLREWVFGGVTDDFLHRPDCFVLMSH